MKKLLSLATVAALTASLLAGCGSSTKTETKSDDTAKSTASDIKVGFIFLHDENSTYDKNFMTAAEAACDALGIAKENVIEKTNIPEGNDCYEAAAELVDEGCTFIFADSFGHEEYLLKAAKEFKDVQFAHATGTMAHTEKLDNFHNAFASIYDGRYLAGIAAGMKLNEMIAAGEFTAEEAKMGYVGAYTYAEVISGYTSFFLGARSVCPSATMEVQFTGSWYDEALEKEAATKLINNGCKLISQHADSMGAPTACETANIPNVSYNGSTEAACPNTFIVSSRIDWQPYFEYAIKAVMDGEKFDTDWTGDLSTGSVVLTDINEKAAAEGTADAIKAAEEKIKSGELHVFDITTFTVDGAQLDTYMADVDTDAEYTADTEAIVDGYFNESVFRSAPYFNVNIDGIELLNTEM